MAARIAALSLETPLAKDACASNPRIEFRFDFLADHGMKALDERTSFDKRRHSSFDGRDGNSINLAQMIARRGHHTHDGSSGRDFL